MGWIASDTVRAGDVVLELGIGLGAAVPSYFVAGATHCYGVDINPTAVDRCAALAGRILEGPDSLTLAVADYHTDDLAEALGGWGAGQPTVVLSNPPYTPGDVLAAPESAVSAFGGADGLDHYPRVLDVADRLGARLGLAVGTTADPARFLEMIEQRRRPVRALNLCALPFGTFSGANRQHIEDLERRGRALLWRPDGGDAIGYLHLGLTLGRPDEADPSPCPPTELLELLRSAARSTSTRLERVQEIRSTVPLRILALRACPPTPPAPGTDHVPPRSGLD